MRSILILLIIAAAIIIPLMVLHRRYKAQREAAEMREANVLQDAVFEGSRNMRGDISRCPVMSRTGSKPELRVVEKRGQSDDSAWMFGASTMGETPSRRADDHADHIEVRTPGIFKGQGGTFDGAGASADWDEKRSAPPVTGPGRSDDYATPASYARSSSPSHTSDDSGSYSSPSSDTSSSSSDSGSSSSD